MRQSSRKPWCYIFILFIFSAFLQAGFYAATRQNPAVESTLPINATSDRPEPTPSVITHPIPKYIDDAEARFRKKVSRQSRTLSAAVAEYKKKYKRPPPKDFDRWFSFAQQHKFIMMDEFDGLMEDLAPFWQLSGEEFRRRSVQAANIPSMDRVRIRDGKVSKVGSDNDFSDPEVGARAKGFINMMSKFVKTLPNMEFAINTRAEGRVLVPWEHLKYPNMTGKDSAVIPSEFIPDWSGGGNVWENWRRTCDPNSKARHLFSSLRNMTLQSRQVVFGETGPDFSFTPTTSYSINFCSRPYAHYAQGHFFSDWRTIPALYPVLSPGKARGFMDIRIPSHYYFGGSKRYTYGWDPINLESKDEDAMEVPWEQKEDKIFWRGATTGGGNSPPGFSPFYQRHRFLKMSSDRSDAHRVVTFADPPSTTQYISVPVPVSKLNQEIMDVAFTKATNPKSYPGGLKALMADCRFADAVPLGKHWSYKYLVDFDGMGYSARFLAFLASDSAVIKSTVYSEFFSDWIQPWVHFIPLSSTYKEIYNIHAFFSGPTTESLIAANSTTLSLSPEHRRNEYGDARLRRIARAGKQWKQTIGRKVDMEVYIYRLCLEYARLWADDRDSMNFSL